MSYLLDANVFIQAKNLHYGLDFCPAFWQWLIDSNNTGRVHSIDKVRDELAAGADELTDWINSTKRIKIPNVCAGLKVRFMTPYQMLRIEQARFVLGARL